MSESVSEVSGSIGEVRVVDPAQKKHKTIIGIDPGPHCGLVVIQKDAELGWVCRMRWTLEFADAPVGDTHCHWAREVARVLADRNLARWFEMADKVVLERQYVQHQPLPSFLIMQSLLAAIETKFPGRCVLVGSNEVKAAYFTESQRKNYAKRKQVAELMTKDALARATLFDPTQRVHDQSDAFLVACYWLDYVVKRSPDKLSLGYRRKSKVADGPKSKEEEEEYKPRPRVMRKRKSKE